MTAHLAWAGVEAFTLLVLLATIALWWRTRMQYVRTAEELHRTSETLRHAEKLGRIGTWYIDIVHGKLHWSDRVFEIHARPLCKGEPDLDSAIEYYAREDRPMVEAMVGRAIENGVPFEFTATLVAEDGTRRNVLSRGMCLTDKQGQTLRVFGVFIESAHVIQLAAFVNDNLHHENPGRPDWSQ